MKRSLLFLQALLMAGALQAQTINDGLLMPAKTLCTGFMVQQDQWKNYWEGSLKRNNLNIGTFTMQSAMWYGVYGVNDKVNVMAMLPYVSNKVSGGTLHSMKGIQDLTLAAKYNFLNVAAGPGKFTTFVGGSVSTPLSDYTPDFMPLSIGMASTTLAGRLTANYAMDKGWYVNGSAAYTWRSNTHLDRPGYFTDGVSYSTNEVFMPNVFDFIVDVGYHKGALQAEAFFTQQSTLGGGDIRRQDMPFVSNRMNYSKVGALVMYYLSKPKNVGLRASGNYTIAGRNVGQASSVMLGVLYTFHFAKQS
jgi:Putative MetA-pathway of phenol degradation